MRTESLFSEVVLRLANHPENIATEALAYILRRHPASWLPIRAWLQLTGVLLPDSLAFHTQAAGVNDNALPDLIGSDSSGDQVFILEAKFWADLTPNQPSTYLRRLPSGKLGLVLVVSPGLRLEILWPKLVQNCGDAGIDISTSALVASEMRSSMASEVHSLALTSWRALLSILLRDAEAKGDAALAGDIDQLGGLCARMDSTEFLPLSPNDLSRQIGQRVQQYADLVDRSTSILVQAHGADVKGLTTARRQSTYGRFFKWGPLTMLLAYAPPLWAEYGETPIWLRITDENWEANAGIRERLSAAAIGLPNHVCESDGKAHVGIYLPVGVDASAVAESVVSQVAYFASKVEGPRSAT